MFKKAITYDTADVTLQIMTYLKQQYLVPFYEIYPAHVNRMKTSLSRRKEDKIT